MAIKTVGDEIESEGTIYNYHYTRNKTEAQESRNKGHNIYLFPNTDATG
jgi:hypothetical protein